MKIENGYIIEATKEELYNRFVLGEWYYIFTFEQYIMKMIEVGVNIID